MADKGWKNKEDKVPRRSPRKRGKMCNRPFKAPRRVADVESQVQIITEAQNTREIEGQHEAEPHVIPFVREADECAKHGEVLRSSNDSDVEKTKDNTEDVTIGSDTTSDSDDEVPVALLLKTKKAGNLTLEAIEDCKEGLVGEKAVGKTVAKYFDDVKFTGIIDRFGTERKRHIYHVTYSDGDEKEWSQRELRDGYVLGLGPDIATQWKKLKQSDAKRKLNVDNESKSDEEASEGEGSIYAASSEEETCARKPKRRKKSSSK